MLIYLHHHVTLVQTLQARDGCQSPVPGKNCASDLLAINVGFSSVPPQFGVFAVMIHKTQANTLLSPGLLENTDSEQANRRDTCDEEKCRAQTSSMLSLWPHYPPGGHFASKQ